MLTKVIFTIIFAVLSFYSSAQTFVNASFEDWPDSCSFDTPPIAWENFSVINGPDQRGANCPGSIVPFEGDSYMSLFWSSGGGINKEGASQKVSNLTIGQSYMISFYVIASDYYGYHDPINMLVLIDSTLIYVSPEIIEGDPWTQYFTDFVATDTVAEIAFRADEFSQGSCSWASLGIDVVSIKNTTGIDEALIDKARVFPNPVKDVLHINGLLEDGTVIHIVNAAGQTLISTSYEMDGVDVSSLLPGIYFIYLDENRLNKLKFIKR